MSWDSDARVRIGDRISRPRRNALGGGAGDEKKKKKKKKRHAWRDGHGKTTSTKLPGCFEVARPYARCAGPDLRGAHVSGWKDAPARAALLVG